MKNMVKVKICGITNNHDADKAIELGADALGFVFASSPRQVTPEKAGNIIGAMPPFVKTVGVFVNEETAVIRDIIRFCGLDLIQLHGDEPPDVCEGFLPHTIKAFRLKDKSSLSPIKTYLGKVRAVLFDT